jgi:hypothetical protein
MAGGHVQIAFRELTEKEAKELLGHKWDDYKNNKLTSISSKAKSGGIPK